MDLPSLESRVDALAQELERLRQQVDRLTASGAPPQPLPHIEAQGSEEASEKVLSWVDHSAFLPRLSTVSFLLVVALILRTITDKDIVSVPVGSIMGIVYAGILLVMGATSYFKSHPLSPIFTTCGAVLMMSIVVETHRHFEWLPPAAAYILLAIVCAGGTILSVHHRIKAPGIVAIIGACIASVALELPEPTFPYLMAMLGILNLAAYLIAPIRGCAWVRWLVLGVTLVMMAVWQHKLLTPLAGSAPISLFVQGWFPFVVILFSMMNLGIALLGVVRTRADRISAYNRMLPTLNVLWAYVMLTRSVPLLAGSEVMFAIAGVVAGVGHLMVSIVLSHDRLRTRQASSAMFFAGALLLVLWLPLTVGWLWSVPALSALALVAALLARRRRNSGMVTISIVLQVYCLAVLAIRLFAMPAPALGVLAAATVMVLTFCQYRMRERAAVVLLMVSLVSAFLMLRMIAFAGIVAFWGEFEDLFTSAQSVIINASGLGLMLVSAMRRDKELRNVAIAVMITGACKSLVLDLLGIHGVPLVVSIFSCGIAIAIDSVLLGRWQQKSPNL
jgi:hypothetical protein